MRSTRWLMAGLIVVLALIEVAVGATPTDATGSTQINAQVKPYWVISVTPTVIGDSGAPWELEPGIDNIKNVAEGDGATKLAVTANQDKDGWNVKVKTDVADGKMVYHSQPEDFPVVTATLTNPLRVMVGTSADVSLTTSDLPLYSSDKPSKVSVPLTYKVLGDWGDLAVIGYKATVTYTLAGN